MNLNKRSIASVNEINSRKGGNHSEDLSCYSPCGGYYATTGCYPNPLTTLPPITRIDPPQPLIILMDEEDDMA